MAVAAVAVRMAEVEDTPRVAAGTAAAAAVVDTVVAAVDTEVATNPTLNFVIRTPPDFWAAFSLPPSGTASRQPISQASGGTSSVSFR